MVQVPMDSMVRLLPATVHTGSVVDANATGRPDVALALSMIVVGLSAWPAGAAKDIDCGCCWMICRAMLPVPPV